MPKKKWRVVCNKLIEELNKMEELLDATFKENVRLNEKIKVLEHG